VLVSPWQDENHLNPKRYGASLSLETVLFCSRRKKDIRVSHNTGSLDTEREKKLHTFFCVLSTFSNPTRHVHTPVRDGENLRKSPSRLERPLPTHTTYLRTPNSTNLFHICICKKCEELRGTLYVWGGSPYPGSKWSLCVKMFFFSVWISPKPKRETQGFR